MLRHHSYYFYELATGLWEETTVKWGRRLGAVEKPRTGGKKRPPGGGIYGPDGRIYGPGGGVYGPVERSYGPVEKQRSKLNCSVTLRTGAAAGDACFSRSMLTEFSMSTAACLLTGEGRTVGGATAGVGGVRARVGGASTEVGGATMEVGGARAGARRTHTCRTVSVNRGGRSM